MKLKVTVVAIFALVLTSCGGGDEYPQKVLNNIVNSCMKEGGTKEQCECYSGKIKEKYTFSEFKNLERKLMARKAVPEFTEWVQATMPDCLDAGE